MLSRITLSPTWRVTPACSTRRRPSAIGRVAIDPQNFNWRSCSFAFFEQGKTEPAMEYLELDAGFGVVKCGESFGTDAAGKDDGSTPGGTKDDGKSAVDASHSAGCFDQQPATRYTDWRSWRKRVAAGTGFGTRVLPGSGAGGVRREADCFCVPTKGGGGELLRSPGIAIRPSANRGAATLNSARLCGRRRNASRNSRPHKQQGDKRPAASARSMLTSPCLANRLKTGHKDGRRFAQSGPRHMMDHCGR